MNLVPLRSSLLSVLQFAGFGLTGVFLATATDGCGGRANLEENNDGGGGAGTSVSSGTGSSITASSGSSTSASSTTGSGPNGTCLDPSPIFQANGDPSGFVRCADGSIDRAEAGRCALTAPTEPACLGTEEILNCTRDAECTQGLNGRCMHIDEGVSACGCVYGCATDADCGGAEICACADLILGLARSRCIPADCTTNADCSSGECGLSSYEDGCSRNVSAACRHPESDACRTTSDCSMGECAPQFVSPQQGDTPPYLCQTPNCAIGRPMIVEGTPRAARPIERGDWSDAAALVAAVDIARWPAEVRGALARRFADVGALEHASIGSFARFTLQLLARGAPSELVAEAQRAALDEVEHARAAYALASAFAGVPLGPGALEGATAAVPAEPRAIVRALVEEACVGETLGVAEALALADACADPALAALHRRIAADEQRHAELAWRTLGWLLAGDPSLASAAREGVAAARALLNVPDTGEIAAREAGLLSAAEIASIRRQAFAEVIVPCLSAVGCA